MKTKEQGVRLQVVWLMLLVATTVVASSRHGIAAEEMAHATFYVH